MSEPCPICGGQGCLTYPLMTERFRAGRNREHWRRIHDRINGRESLADPEMGRRRHISRPPMPEVLAAMEQVNACPHRSRDAGCGCSGHRCALGKGKAGIVSHRECMSCVGLRLDLDPA